MDIEKLARKNIRGLRAYEARDIPCRVKLDANESPYGFKVPPDILKTIDTNRYPDPEARELRKTIRKSFKVASGEILFGNGSDELISHLITTFGGPVLYPVPTFSMYGIISQALGEKRIAAPLDSEFDIDTGRMLSLIRQEKPSLIFLSTPNNPTGNCFSADRILRIIEASKGLVVVDEAYQPFSSVKGLLPFLNDYSNLVIMRTLSKIGLAGIRLGFLVAGETIIKEVNKVRLPFNINSFSQAIASEVLRDKKRLDSYIQAVVRERERLSDGLQNMKGIRSFPSEANFILFEVPDTDRVYNALLRKGVLVRNMRGVIDNCLRVTVGTPAENKAFLKELREIL